MNSDCKLLLGDCLDVLKSIESLSVDSLVTDPPAGISFMGKEWDHHKGGRKEWVEWMTGIMRECLRVMKPGAHGLVWALPRTSHWTATALEDAGFEVRDVVTHLFGTGFPKSLDVSKAIDKAAGSYTPGEISPNSRQSGESPSGCYGEGVQTKRLPNPQSDFAKQWQGWGTALKPASEHWILIRKPCSEKTVAANILKWGTGAINIDASRIGTEKIKSIVNNNMQGGNFGNRQPGKTIAITEHQGRFPANLTLDEYAAGLLDEQSGHLHGAGNKKSKRPDQNTEKSIFGIGGDGTPSVIYDRGGGASRFFLCVKYDTYDLCGPENIKAVDTYVGKSSESKSENLSTDGYGNKLMGQFLMGTISITEMGTHSIMTFPILSASTKTFIGTITIESGKTIGLSLVESVVGVSVVSATEALLHFQSGQPEPITGIVSLASDSTLLAGVIETVSTGTRTIGNIVANRFLYCAKASKSEKGAGCTHPTVKAQKLMEYLIRMVTPPNGTVLDPFMGSGSTGVAAKSLGFDFIGIEKDKEYFEIAKSRIDELQFTGGIQVSRMRTLSRHVPRNIMAKDLKKLFAAYIKKKETDTTPQHAVLSASGSERWLSCPGSVRLSRGIKTVDNEWSIAGTHAHTLLQFILENPHYETLLKKPQAREFKELIGYSDEQLRSVEVASDFVAQEYSRMDKAVGHPPTLLVEQKVELEGVGFGTADIILYQPFGLLHVMDYKNGVSVVEAEGNTQSLYYANAVADKFGWNFREVWVTIIQPNADHKKGPVRTWKTTMSRLEKEGDILRLGAKRTKLPNAPLVPDPKYCWFCVARSVCPKQMKIKQTQIMSRFERK